jgi:hypothetical protein
MKKKKPPEPKTEIPTPLEISEFKRGLKRGFTSVEINAGIIRWVYLGTDGRIDHCHRIMRHGSRVIGFIPRQWAYELLESGECNGMRWNSSPNIEPICPYEPPVMIDQFENGGSN